MTATFLFSLCPRQFAKRVAFCVACFLVFNAFLRSALALPGGAYFLWNRGPVREIALAGTSVALETTPSAVVGNPAAIADQKSILLGTFDYGSPSDTTLSLSDVASLKHRYLSFGVSGLLWSRLGVGFGTQQVRVLTQGNTDVRDFADSLVEITLPVAARLTENLSIGATLIRVVERRDMTKVSDDSEEFIRDIESGDATKFGVSFRLSDKFRLGLTHRTSARLTTTQESLYFNHSYVPAVTQAGFWWNMLGDDEKHTSPISLSTMVQLDVVTFPGLNENIYFSPGIVYDRLSQTTLSKVTKFIPRVSMEMETLRGRWMSVTAGGGVYIEPPYLLGSFSRSHITGGVSFVVWHVSLNASIDVARDFLNKNIGLGLVNIGF